MITRLFDARPQIVQITPGLRMRLGIGLFKLTRRIRLGLDFRQIAVGRLDGQLQLGLVGRQTLVADDGLAGRRLHTGDLITQLGRPTVALDGLRTGGLNLEPQCVDLLLGRLEDALGLFERIACGRQRVAQQLRLLRQRFGLHLDVLELSTRIGDFAAIALGKTAVFLDTLCIDADDLVSTLKRTVGSSLFTREGLQALLKLVDLVMQLLLGRFRRHDDFRRLGNGLVDFLSVGGVQLELLVKIMNALLRDVDVETLQLIA